MDSVDDLLLEEILHPRTADDKLDPSKILELCHRINERRIGGCKAVRTAKRSLFSKDPVAQLHALTLLDALASNCTNIFPDFASEHVVDDIVKVISHGMTPAANQAIANKLVTQLAEHIPLPSVLKEQFEQTCRKGVQGLLKDLTSSPQNEALHLQKWLEGFSNKLLSRADGVTAQVQGLLENTGAVELELHNVFNSFRGLSSSQFVENLVYEEDELEITNEDLKIPEQGMPSQSYDDDIVLRYKEAVTAAWGIYEQHIWKPSTVASSSSNSRVQVPHIIGTEDFMRDNSCGLAEDRSFGFEALDSESDTERDGAAEITDARILPKGEWSGSESEVADEQIGGFKPSVSAALDFKAMLEAALRSPYIPQKVDAFTSKRTSMDHLDGNIVPAIQRTMPSIKIVTAVTTTSDQIRRSVSKEGYGALKSGTSLEPELQDQISTPVKVVKKPIPQHAEVQKSRNWKQPSSEKNTTTVISNDGLRNFHTSMMSGGLFDDENEDSDLSGSQSANIWSHTTRTYDASGTHIEKHEKERNINDEFLVSEAARQESEALSNPKKPSFPHSDETFPARSYAHIHDSLLADKSTSSASLKETLPFLRKGLFEDEADNLDLFGPGNDTNSLKEIDDEDEEDSEELFGPSNDTTSLKEIDDTNFTDLTGNFKGMSSSSNSSVVAKLNLVDEISKKAGVARGDSFDFGNEAAVSTEAGLVIKEPDTGITNNNIEGLSRQGFTLSSAEPLSEIRQELEEESSVSVAQLIAHEKSNLHGFAANPNRFLKSKTTHILDDKEVLNAKLDDDVASWSSASRTTDTLNLGENSGEAFLANGFKPGESQHQTGNLEVLAEHPTPGVEEVTDSIHLEFLANVVKQQNGDESGKVSTNVVEPPMANMNFPREKTNERPQNISSNWSRKLTSLQEQLSLQPEMFSPQQRRIPKTQWNIFVDDAFDENKLFTPQTQRPSPQATSEDMKSLYHTTMSRPRGPERRAPTSRQSRSPVLMANTKEEVVDSPEEECAGGLGPDFVVQENESIERTKAYPRTNDTLLHSTFTNTYVGALANEGVTDDTLSMSEGFTKSSKITTDKGFADEYKARNSQAGPSNASLFEDEDHENSWQGKVYPGSSSLSPLLESKLSQSLACSDKGSSEGDFAKALEGAAGNVPGQTLKHQLSPRECFRRSLLYDDDEDDNDLFS